MDIDIEPPTSPLSSLPAMSSPPAFVEPNTSARQSARSNDEKLELAIKYMRDDLYFSIGDFVKALSTAKGAASGKRRAAFSKAAYEDPAVLKIYMGDNDSADDSQVCARYRLISHLDVGRVNLRREVKKLCEMPPFRATQQAEAGAFTRLNMGKVIKAADDSCPLLMSILRPAMLPWHVNSAGNEEQYSPQQGCLITILAVMCRSMHLKEASGFQLQMGLYLHSKGVKRRQLEALCRLGLCSSYQTVLRAVKRQSDVAAGEVTSRGQQPTVVTAYDNFEQMEHVKEQRVDNEDSFRSVTTGQLISGIEMPEGGLKQSMLNQSIKLRLTDIICAPGNERDAMELEQRQKTSHASLGPIPHDESTNVGNLNVLANIFEEQYKLPEDVFQERLFLIYGDQKTTQRIRTVKSRRSRSARAVDGLRWALPVPALFHLRMNYLYMLSRVHFGAAGDGSKATLYYAANLWIRKGIQKKKADFYSLEQLVIHSFQARICAIMWSTLAALDLGRTESDIRNILRSYDTVQINELVDKIVESYIFDARYTKNLEVRNHILFLQQSQNYLTMKHAIKHADLGLLLRSIRRSAVYFHGSGQHKYAYEMLYFLRLTTTEAASPELQRAIMANSLVNTVGADDSWYETDRLVEFHNGTLKTIFKDRRGSAITVKYLIENCALNTEFFRSLAENMESFLDMGHNGKHPDKSVARDIIIMAEALTDSGSISGTQRRPVNHEAIDLFDAAAPRLAGPALGKFNQKECMATQTVTADDFDAEEEAFDEADQFFDGYGDP
ncbi:hypothetical protein MRS44_013102 [Fusarium solani]|uniref:uncharacterized protein n=1 Tax=Fusarium solani TaxID=169388 RepID=UPI0032C3E64C|nr:hypothetical protein MRS44_013102 [Fusarium solani]